MNCEKNHIHNDPIILRDITGTVLYKTFNTVDVQENTKITEIRDVFRNLRYTISLVKYDVSSLEYTHKYEITVVNNFSALDPFIILTIPEKDSLNVITDYREALKIYHDCIKQYVTLVKAETKDFQDINVFEAQTGYKLTTPKCCATCKWCVVIPPKRDYINRKSQIKDIVFGVTGKMKCLNPNNQQAFRTFENINDDYHCEIEHGPVVNQRPMFPSYDMTVENNGPFSKPSETIKLAIHPTVDEFGLCPKYIKQERKYIPCPGDSLSEILDKYIHTVIIPEVGNEIDNKLNTNPPILSGNRDVNDYNNDGLISEDEEITYNGGNA